MSKLMRTMFYLAISFNILTGVAGAINEYAAEEQQMLDLINAERELQGLEPLRFNAVLNEVAIEHSREMIEKDYFSHDSYDGTSFSERLTDAGYDIVYVGENIALHYPPDLVAAHEGLMASSGHRANILSPNYNEIGIGIWVGEYSAYSDVAMYTQDFGWSDSVAAPLQITAFSPSDDVIGSGMTSRIFFIDTNTECDISWSFNGENVKTESNVMSSSCEITPQAGGTYQVKVIASDKTQNVGRQWTWIVTEEVLRMKGDANNDGLIDLRDLSAFALVYDGTATESVNWADFNDDGQIDLRDLSAFALVYKR